MFEQQLIDLVVIANLALQRSFPPFTWAEPNMDWT